MLSWLSGGLAPEEEAAVWARLAEFAKQKNEMVMSALAKEEAELARRLESGELSPEEETEARARLRQVAVKTERQKDGVALAALEVSTPVKCVQHWVSNHS
jgi:hypothetical protein